MPIPVQVLNDPVGAVRGEVRRLRGLGVPWASCRDRIDLRWVDKAQLVYADANERRTHGFWEWIEAPLRQEAA